MGLSTESPRDGPRFPQLLQQHNLLKGELLPGIYIERETHYYY